MKLCDSKLLHTAIDFSGHSVEVNRTFEIEPEPLRLYSEKLHSFVEIPIPMSHIGEKPIKCRLISAHRRMEMVEDNLKFMEKLIEHSFQIGEERNCTHIDFSELSQGLLIHVHGGGFISQSSKTRKT